MGRWGLDGGGGGGGQRQRRAAGAREDSSRLFPRCFGFSAALTQECPWRGKGRERGIRVEKLSTGRSEVKGQHWLSKA